MKIHRLILTTTLLLSGMAAGNATELGFGQLGGNNATVPASYGSRATTDANGYVVSPGGATPNIALAWDANWDIHTSAFFGNIENQVVGGGAWDNEGNLPRVGQLDFGNHTLTLSADPGYALVLNSFVFGHTAETAGNTDWNLTLTKVSSSSVVWNQSVSFVNGQTLTLSPGFTGEAGESYVLAFDRTAQSYTSNGRHGLDNLNFGQITVPEPTAMSLFAVAGLAFLVRCRRGK